MRYANALEYLDSKLKEERSVIIDSIVQGKLDEAEYKRLCGALQGLDLASNLIKDLATRMEQNDE
jgi:hypothetical protein